MDQREANGRTAANGVVELRVHGVSTAGPDHVLDRPHVQQVAGDAEGGFYRPRPGQYDSAGVGGVTLEAYRWNNLPSRSASRTLAMVFLLPFMLINVAIWMRPASARPDPVIKALCRLLALTLTATYVLSSVGVALDVVAWKCMSSADCLAGRSWLSWIGGRPAGLRLAVLALAPAAAIGLVWGISARHGRSLQAMRASDRPIPGRRLSGVGQWDVEPLVGRLRSIHVAAAFATLDVSLLTARAVLGISGGTLALAAATGLVLIACVVLLCTPPLNDDSTQQDTPRPSGTTRQEHRLDRAASALRTIALGLTVAVTAHVLTSSGPWPVTDELPGYDLTVIVLFIGQAALLAALGAVLLRRRRRRTDAVPLLGLGSLAAAAAAISLEVTFSAELIYRVSDVLNRDAPTEGTLVTSPPRACTWAILGFALAALVTLAVAGVVALVSRPGRMRAAASIVARDFPDAPGDVEPRLRQVRRTIARARFTERLVSLAVVYACLAGLGMTTVVLGLLKTNPGELIQRYVGVPAALVHFGIGVGSYLVAAIIVGLLLGGIFAHRTPGFRRYVGVLWDLGTFWPRACHPFAPACYAERAVPELTRRITYLVDRGDAVLLTGHSHGSVLIAATVLQLPPRVTNRIALLTHGSPLRRLYSRLFPSCVSDEVVHEIADRVGWRWVNLWRDTDPIGGQIFSPPRPDQSEREAAVDRRLRDPRDVVAPPGDIVPPAINGHRPCELEGAFDDAVRDLAERLRSGPRTTLLHTLRPASHSPQDPGSLDLGDR
ncbi:hypothetical protein [Micromonospora sp. 067-2]|uniref:hypothetical protein n=1 Tax=Micromonospora sp. 067-2 TaxID=2789270 RepID=UPI00397A8910